MRDRKSLTWRSKLLLLLSAFAVAPVIALAYWATGRMEDMSRASTLDALEALASAKAEAIDQFTSDRRNDVERIATLIAPFVAELEAARADAIPEAPPRLPGLDREHLPDPMVPDGLIQRRETAPAPEDGATGAPDAVLTNDTASAVAGDGPASGARVEEPPAVRNGHAMPLSVVRAQSALRQPLSLILWDQARFEEFLVIDHAGKVIASTFDGHEGLLADRIEYFLRGRKATFMQPVFLSPITGKLTMVIATPILDENRGVLGVLAARLNLERLYRLIGDRTGLGQSGETVVGQKIDANIVFTAPTRHMIDAAFDFFIPIGDQRARDLQEAAMGQRGSGLTTDYRGVHTLAAWRYVPSIDWGLLVKIDYEEAIRSASQARNGTLLLTLVILVIVMIAAFVMSRAFLRPLQEFKDATDRISRGDLNVQLEIRSQDEIGELADSFERMVAAIKFFRERSREAEEGVQGELDDHESRGAPI